MSHLPVLPIVLPAALAAFILMTMRHHLELQRIFSIAGAVALSAVAALLVARASDGQVHVYELGDWPAPFGIALALDRLSAMMVALTALLLLAVTLYAVGAGWDARGRHFHALLQFQAMGVCGAFLTADAFNLFVFFEILLIASYGLMIHAGGAERLRAGFQYVAYNLLGSTLFLFAMGALYAATGTLNMADLGVRIAQLPAEHAALARAGAALLILVFAVKAAALPVHFWLPGAYAAAPGPSAAMFAILTKVGVYAILRMRATAFPESAPALAGLSEAWLLPAALATALIGAAGVLGARGMARLAAFGTIASVGTLLIAAALFTPQSAAAALYYMPHSTLAAAVMFLAADMVTERRGDAIAPGPRMAHHALVAAVFFLGAVALAGLPPLSGFLGKLMIMDAARGHERVAWIWGVILVASLITLMGLARAGSDVFWRPAEGEGRAENREQDEDDAAAGPGPAAPAQPSAALTFVAAFALLAALAALTVLAGPAMRYADAAVAQLFDAGAYADAVLRRP
ncbi:monovalent cation/H+ antiporter subunit D [Oceanicella actignis]|uniref:Multicomponent K+:H+ antiporter subunit D n=1 Tax=Oceanicella actignis TaxID=1189325 RepID=A0A1M7SHW5_9RHOB|nr:monovalent cation/H+ antiporter subunit D [Oceanicella actignis]SET18648.1 multisubunit potassium/proton antiporter, PhaD subunit [Oceanicella actignis]SHN58053.1 multicomponent K+:H+ antiporter subunit D [Oceanicella actignis]